MTYLEPKGKRDCSMSQKQRNLKVWRIVGSANPVCMMKLAVEPEIDMAQFSPSVAYLTR